MLNATGSSTFASPAGTGPSTAGLQAQLDRYRKQLSDCVNCNSAQTIEGQKVMQTISNRIGEIKARIEKIATERSNTQLSPPNAGTATGNSAVATAAISVSATATVGSILNVFA